MAHEENPDFFKGRGAQVNTHNKFLKKQVRFRTRGGARRAHARKFGNAAF